MNLIRAVSMRAIRSSLLMTAALLLCAAPAAAQSTKQGLVEMEGPLEFAGAQNGANVIKVLGVTVTVTPSTKLTSPTTQITYDDLAAGPALPGRTEPGFLNGHAIVTGTHDASGVYAQQVYIEPSEHHLIGTVTRNDAGGFEVEGTSVVLLPASSSAKPYPDLPPAPGTPAIAYDKRLPGATLKNAAGFEISPTSVAVGTNIVVAGYYVPNLAGKGILYAHTAIASGNEVSQGPQVSIVRAECRQRAPDEIEWDVRGGTVPDSGTVKILNGAGSVQYGVVNVSADSGNPGKGLYRLQTEIKKVTQQCPTVVQAQYTVGGKTYTATASVERR
jgi:hypothetical protein